MNREQFFQELRTALHREGFTPQPEQDELLPVEWDGLPLCRITADGGVRYWQEDVATPERERACERATDLACTVREYMTLLEQAPPLQAQSLTDDYRLLADFNGAVLAAHPTRLGVQFVTWDWSFDRTGLNQGNYFQENYAGAKQDFAIRAGLISKQQIFNQEQLVEIYRCCSDTLDAGFDWTAEQEKCIRGVQEQIATLAGDMLFDEINEIIASSKIGATVSKRCEKRIDTAILSHYTKAEIKRIKKKWNDSEIEPYFKKALGQTLDAYLRKEYALVIPFLATMWEGIIKSKVGKNEKKFKEKCKDLVDENGYDEVFSDFFNNLIFGQCYSVNDVVDGIPNRNGVAHSWYIKYPSQKAALNAILLTDFVLSLKPKNEAEDIEKE